MKVGFIGLGTMGGSMAYNALDGGNELVVHDINPASATRHLEAGATWVDTPRAVAEQSEIVFTSLPGPTQVEAVALGESIIGRTWSKPRGRVVGDALDVPAVGVVGAEINPGSRRVHRRIGPASC